jgi:hypothetical protein
MFNDKNPITPVQPPGDPSGDAVFIGWQGNASGVVFALYEITAAGHPALGSTVSEKGLRKLRLRVPNASQSQMQHSGSSKTDPFTNTEKEIQ